MPTPREMAKFCAEHADTFNRVECDFIDNMVSWTKRRQLTERQLEWLIALYDRAERRTRRGR